MDDRLRAILGGTRTVAVLGVHADPARPAYRVPDYLRRLGLPPREP